MEFSEFPVDQDIDQDGKRAGQLAGPFFVSDNLPGRYLKEGDECLLSESHFLPPGFEYFGFHDIFILRVLRAAGARWVVRGCFRPMGSPHCKLAVDMIDADTTTCGA